MWYSVSHRHIYILPAAIFYFDFFLLCSDFPFSIIRLNVDCERRKEKNMNINAQEIWVLSVKKFEFERYSTILNCCFRLSGHFSPFLPKNNKMRKRLTKCLAKFIIQHIIRNSDAVWTLFMPFGLILCMLFLCLESKEGDDEQK